MAGKREFRGHYCKRCHTYTRLYRDNRGDFTGICPRCNTHLLLPADFAETGFFHSETTDNRSQINVWDHYDGGRIIGQVSAGTGAKLLGTVKHKSVNWYRIQYGEITGWVSGKFIRRIKK